MRTSIIIPTSGTGKYLPGCLESLRQTRGLTSTDEIIVVQNGGVSPDELGPDAEQLAVTEAPVKTVHEQTQSLLAGRHRGVQESSGDVLIFLDDDVEVGKEWLAAIKTAFENESVVLVGGPSIPEYQGTPPAWLDQFWAEQDGIRACPYLSLLDAGPHQRPLRPDLVWGLNFAIRKTALQSLGGFHPDGVPWDMRRYRGDGESGLALKMQDAGLMAVYEPKAVVRHMVPANRLTIEYFQKRAFLQGISNSYSDLRRDHGLYRTPKGDSLLQRLYSRIMRVFTKVQQSSVTPEIIAINAAQKSGYDFHQSEVRADPGLLQWVTRENYWDYNYPTSIKDQEWQLNSLST